MEELKPRIQKLIRDFPDFPKTGILFKDIMPLFKDPQLVAEFCHAVANHVSTITPPVEAVAGLEARGFLFGPQIAAFLNVPFVPIRKKGKLPGPTVGATYIKEYGEDSVEIQTDALKSGTRVFIFDDLLATGGTMTAAINLIEKAGGVVSEAFCIIELVDLKARENLKPDVPFYALLPY